MADESESLEIQFPDSDYGLSGRRLWEFTNLDQINVFGFGIDTHRELQDAARFIDVIRYSTAGFELTGLTLHDLRDGGGTHGWAKACCREISSADVFGPIAKAFMTRIADHLGLCSERQATRNKQQEFLPLGRLDDPFGISGLHSSLTRRLLAMGMARASPDQWRDTIENFRKKGLRAEELERSGLLSKLLEQEQDTPKPVANELAALCDFEVLRMSVIPVVRDAQRQLHFTSVPTQRLIKTKQLSKAQNGQRRTVSRFDPILGYRLEKVEHQTLWGEEAHWQAVTHKGHVIADSEKKSLYSTIENAAGAAAGHAQLHFPKRVAIGRWNHIAWSGGEEYREWLLTLPYFRASFFSSHFNVRNVLIHVRCDIRRGGDEERVLLLQEVQSDWAQNVRRYIASGDMVPDAQECPPFLKEWPSLAMKLMLLYAAKRGVNAVAWTRGAHQAFRYKGLGAIGLTELYDRTIPREVNRMMKPFGVACEPLGVFVPTNFSIRQSEAGYEVFTAENERLGIARTLDDAREFVPDGGHELLYEVHGVRISGAVRKEIQDRGFPAWG